MLAKTTRLSRARRSCLAVHDLYVHPEETWCKITGALLITQLGDVDREPNVTLEQSGQQFFLNISGPHGLNPRQGRAGHSPHMVSVRYPAMLCALEPSVLGMSAC